MKQITEEQINKAINEAMLNVSKTIHQDFLDNIAKIPDDCKDNPIAYDEICFASAVNKTSVIVLEVLKKLLID